MKTEAKKLSERIDRHRGFVGAVGIDDVTVTLVRNEFPQQLLRDLKRMGHDFELEVPRRSVAGFA